MIVGLRVVLELLTSSTSLSGFVETLVLSLVDRLLASVGRRLHLLTRLFVDLSRTLARSEFRQAIVIAPIDKHLNCTESDGQALCDLSEDFMQ